MPDDENVDEKATSDGTVRIVRYGTIIAAPDDCVPTPTVKEILNSEAEAVASYRNMLRDFRRQGLVVVMTYVESVE